MFRYNTWLGGILGVSIVACNPSTQKDATMQNIDYPVTAKVAQVDDYHGTEVADPYRWLEVSDSSAVRDWIEAQNTVTFDYLAQIPYREALNKRLTTLWNYPKQGIPYVTEKYHIYTKNDGLQNQSIYYIKEGEEGKEEVLIDPNQLSKEGTVAVSGWSVSDDEKYFGYAISEGGSDWQRIQVMDLATKKLVGDPIEWVKFSGISWYKDGFFYGRYDQPEKGKELESKNEFHKIYYHKIGTSQSEDALIHEDKETPLQSFYVSVEEKEDILYIYLPDGTGGNALYFKDLATEGDLQPIIATKEAENGIITTVNRKVYIITNHKAPKRRLVEVDLANPTPDNWKDIIPEGQYPLSGVSYAGGRFFVTFMKDASHLVSTYDITGKKLNDIQLPTLGTVGGFGGDEDAKETYYYFTSFLYPPTIYKYDIATNTSTEYFKPNIDFSTDGYETKEVFYPSKDGTKVHMFITHKKGLKLDGSNPTYLYGYGGFNISINPSFDTRVLPFLEQGGIYAVANLRGGSEYGEEWHKDGMLENKQNVFDDFIGAAEYLIKEKYTSKEKLSIAGRSNGGLLVGACMTQRPDLFAVALPGVGVLDMLRFHKFTIGWAWVNEYGSSDDKAQFNYLKKYSPLHNVTEADYPATLVYTADHDDRVVPAHSFKFIATLQEKHTGKTPVLIRIDVDAGHGAGKPISKQIAEWADIWAFTLYNLGIEKLPNTIEQ
ncbi:MAG: prolyl oligopeptidase family protein [Thermonemataceae bacterium]